jgi:hypothetical protein
VKPDDQNVRASFDEGDMEWDMVWLVGGDFVIASTQMRTKAGPAASD